MGMGTAEFFGFLVLSVAIVAFIFLALADSWPVGVLISLVAFAAMVLAQDIFIRVNIISSIQYVISQINHQLILSILRLF